MFSWGLRPNVADILYCVGAISHGFATTAGREREVIDSEGIIGSMLLALLAMLLIQGTPAIRPGVLVERVPCPSDPSQTYSLYLPSGYTTARRWPLLLVFDPGGRGARAAGVFRDAAERYGWIVAASENSRNGPWEPTRRAIQAMWPALL